MAHTRLLESSRQTPGPLDAHGTRDDSSAYFLGLRLNFFVAIVMTIAGLAWFAIVQFRGRSTQRTAPPQPVPASRR
jgi:hypothetical protein